MKRTLLPLAVLALGALLVSPALAATPDSPATQSKSQPAAHAASPAAPLRRPEHRDGGPAHRLPGVGEAYAKKIIAGRPYKAKDELVERKVVPESAYKQFSAKVVAHHSQAKQK